MQSPKQYICGGKAAFVSLEKTKLIWNKGALSLKYTLCKYVQSKPTMFSTSHRKLDDLKSPGWGVVLLPLLTKNFIWLVGRSWVVFV